MGLKRRQGSEKGRHEKMLGSKKCDWRGMPTIMRVNFERDFFLGGAETLEK